MNRISLSISRLLTRIHTLFLNNKFNSIGRGSRIYFKSQIINKLPGGVCIGENCMIGRTSYNYHAGMPFFTTIQNDGDASRIVIGNNCRINGAYIHAQESIVIGDNCVMASGINIIDSNAHRVNCANRTKGRDNPKEIRIGNNVWIGLNVVILKGTILGNNCVVGAGSVVKGTFPDNSIIQGNPAVLTARIEMDN